MPTSDHPTVTAGIRPRSVLVPLDGSTLAERAVPPAARIAARLDLPLTLMTATDRDAGGAVRALEAVAAELPTGPVDCVVLEQADAADAIGEVTSGLDEPLICMTTHGRGGLRWAVMGSVAESVLARTDRPVMLVGRHCDELWTTDAGRVAICHDGSQVPAGLVELGCDWADALHAPIAVITVVHPLDVESAEYPEGVFAEIAARIGAQGRQAETELIPSRYAAGALADAAASTPTALLVMASHTRHGLPRVVVGSTTTGTVALAPCPVLVLPLVPDPSHA